MKLNIRCVMVLTQLWTCLALGGEENSATRGSGESVTSRCSVKVTTGNCCRDVWQRYAKVPAASAGLMMDEEREEE